MKKIVVLLSLLAIASCQVTPKASKTLKLAEGNQAIGPYVVDENNYSLYIFQNDQYMKINCSGACLTTWPAYTVATKDSVTAATGVTGTIGYIAVGDKFQVTLNGWPLYYYKGEIEQSLINQPLCQGINQSGGLWFVLNPNGTVNLQNYKQWSVVQTGDINLSETAKFGDKYIVDKDGVVLYIFGLDTFMKSNCFGQCLTDWPLYGPANGNKYYDDTGALSKTGTALKVGTGVKPELFTVAKGVDTASNLTTYLYAYNGWPLYYYKDEKTKGTAKCQGIKLNGGYWWLLLADGNVNRALTETATKSNPLVSWGEKQKDYINTTTDSSSFLKVSFIFALLAISMLF